MVSFEKWCRHRGGKVVEEEPAVCVIENPRAERVAEIFGELVAQKSAPFSALYTPHGEGQTDLAVYSDPSLSEELVRLRWGRSPEKFDLVSVTERFYEMTRA